ncbi:MAG: protein kinase [Leptolyngbyaceae cyanobacterium]
MTTLCINPRCGQPQNFDDRDRCATCGSQLRLGGRFRPVEQLGQGGFGRTYLAWDEASCPPQHCVVKQIVQTRSRQHDLAEAEKLAQLGQHPQIPELIAILESPRDLCLVQSYVAGPNLEQQLSCQGPFEAAQVRSLLLSLLPVLQFIHGQGIIHRDVKPENILLAKGDTALPTLVDFGAARTLPTTAELGQTGTVIGSAGYAAPEQALGKALPASDLYGLGVTCLHLLTAVHPFDLYAVMVDDWVWRDYLTTPIESSLGQVLDRLVARSLRSRYTSAEAALADLAPAGIWSVPAPPPRASKGNRSWRQTQMWPTGRTANAIALSPNGRALATANRDTSVQLRDLATGEVLHTFVQRLGLGDGHTDVVTAIAFHPEGRRLLTASQDGTVKQWDLKHPRLEATYLHPGWQLTGMTLSASGETLITADAEGRISVWDVASRKRQFDLQRHAGRINDLVLSPDGHRLASVDAVGTLRLWALPTGELLHTWTTRPALEAVALSLHEPTLITGDQTGQVTLWSLLDFAIATPLIQTQDAISALAISPDEQWLAVGSRDRTIRLWHWPAGDRQPIATLYHDWAVCDLTFTSNSQKLISSAADETIRIWQMGEG